MLRTTNPWSVLTALSCTVLLTGAMGADRNSGLQFTATFDPIRIFARPGQIAVRNFRLTTQSDQRRAYFEAKAQDWYPSEDGRQSFYRPAGEVERSCAPWVTLNPVEAQVEPGEPLNVKVAVSVPHEVGPGGYWCVLTVDERPDPTVRPDGVAVQFLASVSVGIFVNIDPIEKAAKIHGVRISDDKAEVLIRNTGNTPLGVEGRVEFLTPDGAEPVAVAAVARRTVVLDPAPEALLLAKLPDRNKLPSGRYIVRVVLDVGLDAYIGVQKIVEVDRGSEMRRAALDD